MRDIRFRAWYDKRELLDVDTLYFENWKPPFAYLKRGRERFGQGECDVVLEQFTGLHDSTKWEDLTEDERKQWTADGNLPSEWKGRRIYEGDILEVDFDTDGETIGKQKAVIQFSEHYASFMVRPMGDWAFCEMNEGKVIGNIHENPSMVECELDMLQQED